MKTDVVTIKNTGASVNINAGPNATHNPPTSLEWIEKYIRNNSGDAAKLIDLYGKVINQLN